MWLHIGGHGWRVKPGNQVEHLNSIIGRLMFPKCLTNHKFVFCCVSLTPCGLSLDKTLGTNVGYILKSFFKVSELPACSKNLRCSSL
jgi:hypothetical protein